MSVKKIALPIDTLDVEHMGSMIKSLEQALTFGNNHHVTVTFLSAVDKLSPINDDEFSLSNVGFHEYELNLY